MNTTLSVKGGLQVFAKMTLKTLAIFGSIAFIAQAAVAQDLPEPQVSDLPALRTQGRLRAQKENDSRPGNLSSRARRDEDVAKVVPVKCKIPTGKFPFNFDKVKVTDMVDQISQLTCKNFIISSTVRTNTDITIKTRTPVDVDQAWQTFLSALESNDLGVVKVGSYYKILRRMELKSSNVQIYSRGETLPDNEGFVTMLYDVRYIPNQTVISVVSELIKGGQTKPIGDSFLLFSDTATNIRRVMKVLEKVDVPGATNRVHILEVEHAVAKDIQQKVSEIFDTRGSSGQSRFNNPAARFDRFRMGGGEVEAESPQKIVADDRTNKLIIIASDKAYESIKELIDLLDVPASGGASGGAVNVYFLKNGDSKKLATTLQTLIQGSANAANQARIGQFRPNQESSLFEGEIKITSDDSTNSLVIVASSRDYKELTRIIEKLDKKRAQVYVEAVILEVTTTDKEVLGLDAYGAIPLPNIPGVGQSLGIVGNPGGLELANKVFSGYAAGALVNPAAATAGALKNFIQSIGVLGPAASYGGTSLGVPGVGFVLDVLQTYSNVDILSTPSLTTLDNEAAEISVGERVPVLKGISSVPNAGANFTATQNVDYLDVKLKFGITPHVNDDDFVRLEITQDINSLGEKVPFPGSSDQYIVNNKTTKTVLMTKDQQTVVIGGLVSKNVQHNEKKIPILGDLPILGYLFKKTTDEIRKSNLLLILTPYVIRNEADAYLIYQRKNREREEFAKLYFGDKITRFDPYVDYEKKMGPIGKVVNEIEKEMMRVENGGPGLPGETIVKSETEGRRDREEHTIDTGSAIRLRGNDGNAGNENFSFPDMIPPQPIQNFNVPENQQPGFQPQPLPQPATTPAPGVPGTQDVQPGVPVAPPVSPAFVAPDLMAPQVQ